jgi:COP9 signalosome complex subunit 2
VLLSLVKPYRKVTLNFLAKELSLSLQEVEKLLVDLITNEKLVASIDQLNGFLQLENKITSLTDHRHAANLRFIETLTNLSENLLEAQM